jgi:hypothetical protein
LNDDFNPDDDPRDKRRQHEDDDYVQNLKCPVTRAYRNLPRRFDTVLGSW